MISSLCVFSVFYLLISANIHGRTDQFLYDEVVECRSLLRSKGIDAVKTEIELEAKAIGTEKVFFRIVTPEGKELGSSDISAWKNLETGSAQSNLGASSAPILETVSVPGKRYKARVIHAFIGPGMMLQIAQSLKDDERFMHAFQRIIGAIMLTVIAVSAVVGWFMARRALSGVEEVTKTATAISKGSLDSRVPIKGSGDEIDRLAATFNNMLDRIRVLVTGMKEVNDNIAHDLRSPITRIRGLAEMTLTTKESINEYKDMAASTVEECDRLLSMINTMLDIAEVDAGVAKQEIVEFDISKMVRDACKLFQPVADDKGVTIAIEDLPAARFRGDFKKLQRVLANLLDNALKYTPRGGIVTISMEADMGRIRISVGDTGVGMAEKELPRIFERFYKGDKSRSRAGTGLGLSLARAIVRAHGGDITVTSSPAKGSVFTIILPPIPPAPDFIPGSLTK